MDSKKKEKRVTDILQDISSEICDEYCKWKDIYKDEKDEDKLYFHCDRCPLNRLM